MKKIAYIICFLFILFIGALGALYVFFPKKKALDYISLEASKATQSKVKLEDVGISLSPFGVMIKGFQLGEKATVKQPLVRVALAKIGLKLKPLLEKKIEISEIFIDSPYIEMLQAEAIDEDSTKKDETANPSNSTKDYSLSLESLHIQNGEVHIKKADGSDYVDLAGISEKLSASVVQGDQFKVKGVLKIAQLAFHLPAGTLGKGLSLELNKDLGYNASSKQLRIEQGNLKVGDLVLALTGDLSHSDEKNPSFDVKLQGGPSNVKSILGYLPKEFFPEMAGVSSSGILSIEGFAKGTANNPDYSIALQLKDGTLKYPKLPTALSGIQISVKATPKLITIDRLEAATNKTRISVAGTVANPQKNQIFSLKAKIKADIEELLAMQPGEQNTKASGHLDLVADITGTQKEPVVKGTLNLAQLSYQAEGLPAVTQVNGSLNLGASDFDVKQLTAHFGKSDFVMDGKLFGLVPFVKEKDVRKKNLKFNLAVKSTHLDLDELASLGGKKEEKQKNEKIDTALLDPFTGTFDIKAKEVIYNQMNIKNVDGRAELKRGVFDLNHFMLNVFGGAVKLNGQADYRDIKAPKFDVQLGLQNLESKEILSYASGLNAFGKMAGFLSGKVSTNMALKGALKEDLSLDLKSLFSKGDLSLANATFSGHPAQNALAGFLNSDKVKSFEVKQWLQPFEIKDGALHVSNMKLAAKDFSLNMNGKQQLDGSSEFAMDLVLPQSMSEGIKKKIPAAAAAILFDGSGSNLSLPLSLTGLISSPSFGLNSEKLMAGVQDRAKAKLSAEAAKLQSKLQEDAKQKANDLVQQKLGGSVTEKKEEVKQQVQQEVKKNVGEGAKKLFKKLF